MAAVATDDDGAALLTPDAVAKRLSVSRSMIYSLVKRGPDRGGIAAIYIGRMPRISERDFSAYIARAREARPL